MSENLNNDNNQNTTKIFTRPKVAKSNVIYYDKDGNIVNKEKGCRVHILEFDENDKIINSVWGTYNNDAIN